MNIGLWHYTHYALFLTASALISGLLAIYAWRHRTAPGAVPLCFLCIGAAEWSLFYAIATGFADLATRMLLAKLQYLGIALVPLAMVLFIIQYTGREHWLTRRNLILLSTIPALCIILAWTNEAHGLIWANSYVEHHIQIDMLKLEYGLYFWFYTTYTYIMLLGAMALLSYTLLASSPLQRRQSRMIFIGGLLPWLGNFMYLSGLNPLPFLDLTPFVYSLSGLCIAWGVFRFQFLNAVPVARDKVVEIMKDGVIVIDNQGRILDANPAVRDMLAPPLMSLVGKQIEQVLPTDAIHTHIQEGTVQNTTLNLGKTGRLRYYAVTSSPLAKRRSNRGRLIVFHDITEQLRHEQELQQAKEAAETADRAKTVFLANMSHELRTPLTAILGFSKLMISNKNLTEKQKRNLASIIQGGERLLDLIVQVLDLTQDHDQPGLSIESGGMIETERSEAQIEALDNLLKQISSTPYLSQQQAASRAKSMLFPEQALEHTAALPPQLRQKLLYAVKETDMKRINAVIDIIHDHDPALAEYLIVLATRFEYDTIKTILTTTHEHTSDT